MGEVQVGNLHGGEPWSHIVSGSIVAIFDILSICVIASTLFGRMTQVHNALYRLRAPVHCGIDNTAPVR